MKLKTFNVACFNAEYGSGVSVNVLVDEETDTIILASFGEGSNYGWSLIPAMFPTGGKFSTILDSLRQDDDFSCGYISATEIQGYWDFEPKVNISKRYSTKK